MTFKPPFPNFIKIRLLLFSKSLHKQIHIFHKTLRIHPFNYTIDPSGSFVVKGSPVTCDTR